MNLEEYANNLENCMLEQLEAFNKFYLEEEKVKKHISSRNWHDLETSLVSLQDLADEINKIEADRNNLYSAMKLYCKDNSVENFYAFMSKYCPEKSMTMNSLYRELKVSVIKVKALTTRIDAYLATITTAVSKVLDEAFPMRKGTIYDNKGSANRAASSPPMVLDACL